MNKIFVYLTVFLSGFSLMVLELVAGRLVAPYAGVSIYTWTSVIGIFLLGIALGNYFGGRLADHKESSLLLCGYALLAAALSSLLMIFLPHFWENIFTISLWRPATMTFFAFITFFPTAFFLSFISPTLIKFSIHKLEFAGTTTGKIFGTSTAGSIIGTFLTGFVLIPHVGSRHIVLTIFSLLTILGITFFLKKIHKAWLLIALIIFSSIGFIANEQQSICLKESQYYCIYLERLDLVDQNEYGWALMLDRLGHNKVFSPDVDPFGDTFARIFGNLVSYKFNPNDSFHIMVIGGGAYVVPRYIIDNYPNAEVTVLEIDPKVTESAKDYFGLAENPRLHIVHGDARVTLRQIKDQTFDIIFADTFNDFSVPFQVTTQEYLQELKSHISSGGMYALNLVDTPAHGRFLSSMLLTVNSVFPHTYFMPQGTHYDFEQRHTEIIVGSLDPIDSNLWLSRIPLNDPLWAKSDAFELKNFKMYFTLQDSLVTNILKKGRGTILTDDYAPVDNMILNLY